MINSIVIGNFNLCEINLKVKSETNMKCSKLN